MPSVFQSDLHRYVPKNDIRQLRRYSGRAIFLPDGRGLQYLNKFQDVEVNGDGFMDTISGIFRNSNPVESFFKDNKTAITSGLDVAGKIASTITDVARGAEEIKTLKEMRKQMQDINKAKQGTTGSALYLPEGDGIEISLRTPTLSNHNTNEVVEKIVRQGKGFKILNP